MYCYRFVKSVTPSSIGAKKFPAIVVTTYFLQKFCRWAKPGMTHNKGNRSRYICPKNFASLHRFIIFNRGMLKL
jgi:hypothetical protein